jgi:DNA-dependent protein kinase catalytic subunit
VLKSFRERSQLLRSTVLRDNLKAMADSPEAFFNIRQHFGRTLSTMNACHYLLGIGDRHLSNSMVDLTRLELAQLLLEQPVTCRVLSGGIVGIDFGHNFGSASQLLPVPELFPFRLTRYVMMFLDFDSITLSLSRFQKRTFNPGFCRQFESVFVPHSRDGLLRHVMIHVLKCMRVCKSG